jgi:replication fork protection complex subunit Tof1/Swi1
MSSSDISDPLLNEAAEILQQQLIYNGEVLDITYDSLRMYKQGTQSLAYLDSSVHLAYVLLRMLERWSKGRGDMYVRKKKTKKRRRKGTCRPFWFTPSIYLNLGDIGTTEEDEIPDVEAEPDSDVEKEITETMFTFETFEAVTSFLVALIVGLLICSFRNLPIQR